MYHPIQFTCFTRGLRNLPLLGFERLKAPGHLELKQISLHAMKVLRESLEIDPCFNISIADINLL